MAGQKNRKHRGITLLEVLVAIAAGAVIFGLAMGILITTNQTANQAMGKESLLQQTQLAMKEIRSVIEATVWPEDLATSLSAQTVLLFSKERLGIFSAHNPKGGQFAYCLLGNIPIFITKSGQAGEARSAAGYVRSDPRTGQAVSSFSLPTDKLESSIRFSYATEVGADLQPVWKENLPAGQKPRLIWVELIVRDRERKNRQGQPDEVRMTTAISL
jgi:prepilin-type N-terminal cleavage/methylation domain-containing protein